MSFVARYRLLCLSILPLFFVPQISQVSKVVLSPAAPSSRFPQSVQKTSDPIAVIAGLATTLNSCALARSQMLVIQPLW